MQQEVLAELSRQREALNRANGGSPSLWIFLISTIGEALIGIGILTMAIRMGAELGRYWAAFFLLIVGCIVLGQAAYITFIRFMKRKVLPLYESFLAENGTKR